jgi:hypothetical protein
LGRPGGWLSRPAALAATGALIALAAGGCGGGEGVADGATVTAYAVPPQCDGARRDLDREGGMAGELKVRLVCLADVRSRRGMDLATVGDDARRAAEDSSAVGYIQRPGAAVRYTLPILEEAEIPLLEDASGATSMAKLLDAIQGAGTAAGLREAVAGELE